MTNEEKCDFILELVRSNLGADPSFSENRSTGYAGNVYVVKVNLHGKKQKLVVKLTPIKKEFSMETEPVSNRVYSIKYSNFFPAYELLKRSNFPLAKIYAQGTNHNANYYYQIVSFLEGVSVREQLENRNILNSTQLHEITGEMFGKLHQLTREYDGWIAQDHPYQGSWKSAVQQAIEGQLTICLELNAKLRENSFQLQKFIQERMSLWTDPKEFVFSDIDGFQGMAKFENQKWQITGLIDVEDHKFCDQRMVLAGYEVALRYEGLKAPDEFWQGYKRYKNVDSNYANLKSLFELYYLLSWLQIPYKGHERIAKKETSSIVEKFEIIILGLIDERN